MNRKTGKVRDNNKTYTKSTKMEFSNSSSSSVLMVVAENTTAATKFENPFSKTHVRSLFTTCYVIVFAVCVLGKLFLHIQLTLGISNTDKK